MSENGTDPFFSIIIPTRNRPVWFRRALDSVLAQDCAAKEVIAVVDGSDEEYLQRYRELEASLPAVQFQYLPHRPAGHGQSYSMNVGAALARGQYLCFLDDDDEWTDATYLSAARTNIEAGGGGAQMHFSNQKAYYADDEPQTQPVWLEDLVELVTPEQAVATDCYRVDAALLLRSGGFAHLNCSIFRREFYAAINGMDESIRYENDRDVYIRAIDAADNILYNRRVVSRHNIPDVNKKDNMSTVGSDLDKKLYQMRVYDKGISHCRQRCVLDYCRRGKTYELKHMATILAGRGHYAAATYYAREALLVNFNLRWLGYTLFLGMKSLMQRHAPGSSAS